MSSHSSPRRIDPASAGLVRTLHGREALVRDVRSLLTAGKSVLLFGPEAIGKSAIIAAVADGDITVIDPFDHVTRQHAYELRRAFDRGAIVVAASCSSQRRDIGAVGRILWRFTRVRVRELADAALRCVLLDELGPFGHDVDIAWVREVVALAHGRPGYVKAMGQVARVWKDHHGYLPLPAFAFARIREEAALRTLHVKNTHAVTRHS